MIAFRQARMEDLPDILRLIGEARAYMAGFGIDQWQDGYPGAELLAEDIRIGQLYVLDDESAVAAVAALSLLPEPVYDALEGGEWQFGDAYLTIHRMALDDAHRGSGLASRMLEEAVSLARQNGRTSLRVDTHAGNKAMRAFLEKRGFAFRGWVRYVVHRGDPMRVAYERAVDK